MDIVKKIGIMSGLFFSLLSYSKVTTIASPADFNQKIKSGVVVVKFFAPWCSACKGMKGPFENISKEFGTINFIEVDVDKIKKVADDHDVRSLPTFKYFVDGKEQKNMTHFGGGSASQIKANINTLVNKSTSPGKPTSAKKNAAASIKQQPTKSIKKINNAARQEEELLALFNSKSKEEQQRIIALLQEPQAEPKKTVLKKIKGGVAYAGTKVKDGFSWTKEKIKSLV